MKSIILIVLLALAGNSLGQEFESEQKGNFQVYRQNGGKPILIREEADAEIESDDESADNKNVASTYESSKNIESGHSHDDKIDCNCHSKKPRISYGPEQVVKGKPETYIHHQPKIIVRQPPTHVRIEHPPTIITPSTIVFRRHGKTVRRPVIYQHLPRDVRVRPVIVKVVKPIEKKILVEKKEHIAAHSGSKHSAHDDSKLEYDTEYDGETYSGSFDGYQQQKYESVKAKGSHQYEREHEYERENEHEHEHEHEHVHEHEHEHEHAHQHESASFCAHSQIKEVSEDYN